MKRLFLLLTSLAVIAGGIGFAPVAHAALGTPVVTVIGGNQMFYVNATAADATQFTVNIYEVASGGVAVYSSTQVVNPVGEMETFHGPADSLTNGSRWIEVIATLGSDNMTSGRIPFTMTATPDTDASSFTSPSVEGFDEGYQMYAGETAGSSLGTFYKYFTTSNVSDYTSVSSLMIFNEFLRPTLVNPLTISSRNFAPAVSGASGLVNGTEYFLSAINVGTGGFSAWTPRQAFTPIQTPSQPFINLAATWWDGAVLFFTSPSATAMNGDVMTISGYRVQYTLDNGVNWVTPDSADVVFSAPGDGDQRVKITGLNPALTYRFRMAAIVGAGDGAWSSASAPVTPTKTLAAVTWIPTNTTVTGTSGTITPNSSATTNSDGTLSYAVTSAGSTGCTVNSSSGVITYSASGTCVVAASVPETATYLAATTSVSFVITAPAPAPAPAPSGGGGGESSPTVDAPVSATPTAQPLPTDTTPPVAPTVIAGRPDNPPTSEVVTPGLVLVSSDVAENTAPRVMKKETSPTLRQAPVVNAQSGAPVSLVTSGLTARTMYSVKVKIDGKYIDLGSAETDATGQAQLPVFRATKSGTITIALVNPATGETTYVKVRVAKKKK